MAPLLATGSGPKLRKRGHGEMVHFSGRSCSGRSCLCLCKGDCCLSRGCIIQIYVDDDGDKVGVVEKGEHIEFVNAIDFDSVFDFLHVFDFLCSFYFSYFSDFSCWRSFREVLTLYKKKADKVRPVSRPHEGGLRLGGKGNWRAEAISKERYKLGGAYAGWSIPKFSNIE